MRAPADKDAELASFLLRVARPEDPRDRLLPIWRSAARSSRRWARICLAVGILLMFVVLLFALTPPCLEACGPSLLSIVDDPFLFAAGPLLAAAAYGFWQASLLDAKVRGAERGSRP